MVPNIVDEFCTVRDFIVLYCTITVLYCAIHKLYYTFISITAHVRLINVITYAIFHRLDIFHYDQIFKINIDFSKLISKQKQRLILDQHFLKCTKWTHIGLSPFSPVNRPVCFPCQFVILIN